jgi:hypothetical protein
MEFVVGDVGVGSPVSESHALERVGERRSWQERGRVPGTLPALEGETGT